MVSLREMNERMTSWMNEKPSFDNGLELRLMRDDLVILQFASNGDDGDSLIKAYRSHVFDQVGKNNNRYSTHRYCPIQSGEQGVACANCEAGNGDIKERMSIWFWVQNILHTQMPKEKTFPQIQYQGRLYFNEEVMAWKLWHTSAWKESPWNDICQLYEMYKGLHNLTAQMAVVGDGINRRYKVYAIPQSPALAPELYTRAKAECQPIPAILKAQLGQAVAQNPAAASQIAPGGNLGILAANAAPAPQLIQPFVVPGGAVTPVFNPGAATVIPTGPAVEMSSAPVAAPPVFTPAAAPLAAPATEQVVPAAAQPIVTQPVIEPVAVPPSVAQPLVATATPPAPEAEDSTRPLRSMF